VHWTPGILRDLQAFFWLRVYTALKQSPRRPLAANANRWVAALLIGHRIRSYLTDYQEERIENVVH